MIATLTAVFVIDTATSSKPIAYSKNRNKIHKLVENGKTHRSKNSLLDMLHGHGMDFFY